MAAAVAGTGQSARLLALLRPLSLPDFRLLWIGSSVSLLGDQFYFIALPWLALQLTGSGPVLGALLMAAAIPRAGLMLVGGAVTDRLPPRTVLLLSNIVRGLLVAVVAALVLLGAVQVWQLFILAICFGGIDAMWQPASRAIVVGLAEHERLPAANALLQSSEEASGLAGPALAGMLVALTGSVKGTGLAFGIDSATFVVVAATIWAIRSPGRRERQYSYNAAEPGDTGPGALMSEIAEGVRYAWLDPQLRAVLLLAAAINLAFVGPVEVGLAILAHTRFLGSAAAFGLMFSAWGLGALLGSLVSGVLGDVRRRGVVMVVLAGTQGVGLLLLAVAPALGAAMTVIAAMGFVVGFFNVLIFSWFQVRTEPPMLGRVMSLAMFAAFGLGPISYALAGILASFGAAFLFLCAGTALLATSALAAATRAVLDIE